MGNKAMTSEIFQRHPSADERLARAKATIRAVLALDVHVPHKKELLKVCLWKVTEAEGSKLRTRFVSREALAAEASDRQHEHVFERHKLAAALLAEPQRLEEIVASAVACTVTRAEHARLTTVSRADRTLNGWARYRAAGIRVVDTLTGNDMSL